MKIDQNLSCLCHECEQSSERQADHMNRSSEDLMLAYQSGDTHALEDIFNQYKFRILNYCYVLLVNRIDAEKAAAETFLALMSKKDSFDPSEAFSIWFYSMARHQCIKRLRQGNNFISSCFSFTASNPEREKQGIPGFSDVSAEEISKLRGEKGIYQAVIGLAREQREALVLRQYHGFTCEEAGEIMACQPEKVKRLISSAKDQLKADLVSLLKVRRA